MRLNSVFFQPKEILSLSKISEVSLKWKPDSHLTENERALCIYLQEICYKKYLKGCIQIMTILFPAEAFRAGQLHFSRLILSKPLDLTIQG